jgi:hypothetical protein
MTPMRPVSQLIEHLEPAWPAVKEAIDAAPTFVSVIPIDRQQAESVLVRLQVTTRSVLGALAFETGGIVVEGGWLRILGGGGAGLPDLATANAIVDGPPPLAIPGALIIAHDVLGGRFAVNDDAFPGRPGEVHYFAPDALRWEPLGLGHSDFVLWSMSGRLEVFYENLRWSGWPADMPSIRLDQGVQLWPPPCTAEGKDVNKVSRRMVPWTELPAQYDDMARQLDQPNRDGTQP